MSDLIKNEKKKDCWDIIDILSKLFSSVVLVLILIFIKCGTDKISFSMQKSEFVRNLIADLSMPEKTRKDIALIALDHTLSDCKDNLFVSQIAERVLNTIKEDENMQNEIAYKILKKRNPELAKIYQFKADTILKKNNETAIKNLKPNGYIDYNSSDFIKLPEIY